MPMWTAESRCELNAVVELSKAISTSQPEGYRRVLLDIVTLQSAYWYLLEGEPAPSRETG